MTELEVQGWSYRWDESEYPDIPAELGGGARTFLDLLRADA
jgi:hypothetical protein